MVTALTPLNINCHISQTWKCGHSDEARPTPTKMNITRVCAIYLLISSFFFGAAVASPDLPAAQANIKNPCSEGDFLNLITKKCQSLDKSFGFSIKQFNAAHKPLVVKAACGESNFRSAVSQVSSKGGGTVNLAMCTYRISKTIHIPNNVIIQGKGVSKTILQQAGNGAIIGSPHGEVNNVIIRDLKMLGAPGKKNRFGIKMSYATNVLLERLVFANFDDSNMVFRHSHLVTLRYSIFKSPSIGAHGFGVKDCWEKSSMNLNEDGLISRHECSRGHADYWSDNFSLYSNVAANNGGYGFDLHVSHTELAGNLIENNVRGIKIVPSANNLWVHDNQFTGNDLAGSTTRTSGRQPLAPSMVTENVVFYRNQFLHNDLPSGTMGFGAHGVKNMILIDNVYRGNGKNNTWTGNKSRDGYKTTVFYCQGDEIIKKGKQTGNATVTRLPSSQCDLTKVTDIFRNIEVGSASTKDSDGFK